MAMRRLAVLVVVAWAASAMAAAGPAGGLDAPRAVVKQILAGMTQAGTKLTNPPFEACPALCDPAFNALMVKVGKLAEDNDDNPYDYDVFCQCQDYDNQTFLLVSDKLAGAARYEAIVRGSDKGTKPWTYVLAPTGGKWLVSDVIDETGSVRAGMMKALKKKQ